ncbi:hypothetical protein SAMN05444004_11713 [Jannaschia faecimaris]|uniref:Uncharacterized protein n=1 Tax=Jannaschia faecimaris TaxID=1244108 RepID=A0A1H3THE9_9RHOB|nr:hypothetical protein [Jannaschia faecimaris]SDZ49417.1 hypothetical protein SAMN05444004_11713 [Jannaschia faecimaris]
MFKNLSAPLVRQMTSGLAVCTVLAGGIAAIDNTLLVGTAWAQDDDHEEGDHEEGAGGQGQGGQGQGGQGAQSGQGNQGGSGAGQGGPSGDSDGVGPQSGGPADTGDGGGKPSWAQEGIPEVELGRLSVARSPDQVLDRSLAEALANLTPEMVDFYNLDLGTMINELSLNWDNITIYDSPLQNLALMEDILEDGQTSLPGVTNSDGTLLAVFLGVASDKTVPITTDTVIAVTTILGHPLTDASAESLAVAAEAVRIAVLAGHG